MMVTKLAATGRWLAMIPLALAYATPAQSPEPQLWTSATSGIHYKLTIGDRRLEAEKIFPPAFAAQVSDGAYVRCAYSLQGQEWAGKCRSHLPFAGLNNRAKWCSFKFASKITLLTADRIEGESEVWETEDVDAGKCEIQKSRMRHFVWILKS